MEMAVTTELEGLSPAEVDEKWERALGPARRLEGQLAAARKLLARYERELAMGRQLAAWQQRDFDEDKERAAQLTEDFKAEFEKANAPFKAEWDRRGGWTRYYLVPGGHLHYYNCHTLTPGQTLVGLLYEASGLDAAEVVGKYQVTACTHCFPDAPVARKLTPKEEGFCEYSGVSVYDESMAKQLEQLERRYPKGWALMAVAPGVRCHCGGFPAVTKSSKVRKHKPGKPEL